MKRAVDKRYNLRPASELSVRERGPLISAEVSQSERAWTIIRLRNVSFRRRRGTERDDSVHARWGIC